MSRSSANTDRLGAYVPRLLSLLLHDAAELSNEPRAMRGHGVALIADISGFTELSERLCALGPDGIEELTGVLNGTFGPMVDTIAEYGGDTLRFAGDAPIAIWWSREPGDLARFVPLAAACGQALQRGLDAGGSLPMRVGIGAGSLLATTTGGIDDRWELIVVGAALTGMAAAEAQAAPGQVVVAPEAAAYLDAGASTPVSQGFRRLQDPVVTPMPDRQWGRALPDEVRRAFIPRSVLGRLDAGQARWLAELRRVTVLFGSVRGIQPEDEDAPQRLNHALRALQSEIYRFGGGINQFLMDDKGVTLVAAWGLPGTTHEDDAARALRAARTAAAEISSIGLELCLGVTSGQVYCGARGNDTRCEYAMIGDTVNLAARLMMAADGRILCDAATQSRAPGIAAAAALELELKGKATPVRAFAHDPGAPDTNMATSALGRVEVELIGRRAERRIIGRRLRDARDGAGGVLWIEGEAGIGKSMLVAEVVRQANAASLTTVMRSGDPVAWRDAYLVWRGVLAEILEFETPQELLDELSRRHAGEEEIIDRLPLLGPLIGLELADNEVTRQLSGDVRADATRDLVVRVLEPVIARKAFVLLFDDGHWVDSASWALLRAIARRLPRLLVVIGTRPLQPDAPSDALRLREAAGERLLLEGMSDAEILLLAQRRVGTGSLAPEIGQLITAKAGGHPLFAGELIASLVDSELVQVIDGECRVHPQAGDLGNHAFPDTVQGIIRTRIDRLSADEQLTLKLASVIGAVFEHEILRDIHPMLDSDRALHVQMTTLQRLSVTTIEVPEPRLAYRFHHALIRDVAYGLMLSDQRRGVHADVARWIESRHPKSPLWALLAHHWTRTRNDARSLECLENAGAEANEIGAPREADRFYADALALAEHTDGLHVSLRRKAGWDFGRSEAWFALGDFPRSRSHVEKGLGRIHRPVPKRAVGWYPRLAAEIALQVLSRLRQKVAWRRARTSPNHPQAIDLLMQLSVVAFYQREMLPMTVAGLAAINVAERTGAVATAGQAYAMLGYVVAALGLQSVADGWWTRAADHPESKSRIAALLGRALDAINRARWEAADEYLNEAGALARRAGDRMSVESVLMLQSYRQSFTCKPAEAERTGQVLLEATRVRESLQRELWGHLVIAGNRIERGDYTGALEQLLSGESTVALGDPASAQAYHALLAECRWRLGDTGAAANHMHRSRQLILDNPDLGMGNYYADGPIVAISLGLARSEAARRAHLDRARWSLKRLHRAARVYAYSRARVARLEGDYWHTTGNLAKAARWWHRALEAAESASMPLERGLAHEALANLADREAAAHLASAHELFEQLECERLVRRVRMRLEATQPPRTAVAI